MALHNLPALLKRMRGWRGVPSVSPANADCLWAGDMPSTEVRLSAKAMPDRRVHTGDPRPLKRRFHPAGSPEAERQRQVMLSELQQLVAAGEHTTVLESLGPEMLAP